MFFCNWLGGTLSGPKRPIFRHTSQIFLTVALLRPTKIRFVWQKMASFFVSDATTLTSYQMERISLVPCPVNSPCMWRSNFPFLCVVRRLQYPVLSPPHALMKGKLVSPIHERLTGCGTGAFRKLIAGRGNISSQL